MVEKLGVAKITRRPEKTADENLLPGERHQRSVAGASSRALT